MVELAVSDNKIIFAKWKIEFDVSKLIIGDVGVKWRREPYGFICYTDAERTEAENWLTSKGITYITTDISPSVSEQSYAQYLEGKLNNRSDCLELITTSISLADLKSKLKTKQLSKIGLENEL